MPDSNSTSNGISKSRRIKSCWQNYDATFAQRWSLSLEGASATAAFYSIGIFEREALLFQALVPVNSGAVEIQRTFFIDNDSDAVTLVLGVCLVVKAVVKVQRIAESTAATGSNADSEYHVVAEIVLFLEPLDLFRCSFAQFDCHLLYYPSSWTRIGRLENVGEPLLGTWIPAVPYY